MAQNCGGFTIQEFVAFQQQMSVNPDLKPSNGCFPLRHPVADWQLWQILSEMQGNTFVSNTFRPPDWGDSPMRLL
jgi:hypothetical protein